MKGKRRKFGKAIAFCSALSLLFMNRGVVAAMNDLHFIPDKVFDRKIPSFMKPGTMVTFDEMGKAIILSEGRDEIVSLSPKDKEVAETFRYMTDEDLPEIEPGMVVVYDALGAPVVIHQGQDQSLKIKWKEIRLDENKMNKDGLQDNRNTSQPNVTQLQTETGYISWYDGEGKKGAAGVVLNGKSAAHKTIDFYTKVKTTSLENGKSTIVEILDRGPYIQGRILDMVETAFSNIHNTRKGLFKGRIQWPIQN